MKKIISIISIFTFLTLVLSVSIYAAPLDNYDITTDKETVHPGENVKVDVDFKQGLGSYTVDVAYDNNLLEYVSAEGGTPNDNGTRVRVYFFDEQGGTAPSSKMSVTFKAKDEIVTSNPTNLSITMEGLANADASVRYDDITTPIIKDLIVEPMYEDYTIELNYTGNVIKNEEKDMQLVIRSNMGKNYEHTRIIGQVTTPANESAKLLATDNASLEHDILESGWGTAAGDSIGGKNVVKELSTRGIFSGAGEYNITLSLVDRDNSDAVIATKAFKINVLETAPQTPSENQPQQPQEPVQPQEPEKPTTGTTTTTNKKEPTTLPQTGNTMYFGIFSVIAVLSIAYVALRKKD